MAAIETLFKITASVAGANAVKELANSVKGVSSNGENMARSLNRGAMALKAFAASAAVQAIAGMVDKTIDLADHMNDLAKKTGTSVEDLAKFKVAADNSGTSLDEVASAMVKLSKSQVEAQQGTGAQAAAFRALGISIKDAQGNLVPTSDLMMQISDRFASFPDGPIKSALALQLFGKSGANLIPMLDEGSEAIKRFGLDIDTGFAQAADAFNDNMGIIRAQMDNMAISAAKALMPALTSITDGFVELFSLKQDMSGFFDAVGFAMQAISDLAIRLVAEIRAIVAAISMMVEAGTLAKNQLMGSDTGGKTFGGVWENYKNQIGAIEANKDAALDKVWNPEIRVNARKPSNDNTPNYNPAAATAAASAAEKAAQAVDKWLAKQREEILTLQQEADYIGKTSIEIEKMKDARKLDTEFAEKSTGLAPAKVAAYKQEVEMIKEMRAELMQLNYEQSRSVQTGAQNFLTKYVEDATNAAKQTEQVFGTAFKGLEDAFVEFATTGKLSFKSLATSIIADLARIMVQRTIMAPLASALGGVLGGLGGGIFGGNSFGQAFGFATSPAGFNGPFRGFASGGDHPGGLRIVGENGPELEATGPSRIFNANQTRQILSGGNGPVTINVSVDMKGSNDNAQGGGQRGEALGKAIAAAVRSEIIDQKRPGGLLAS